MRKQLEKAAKTWDQQKIELAIDLFEKEQVPDGEDLLAKAKRRLVHIEVKNGESCNVYECFFEFSLFME